MMTTTSKTSLASPRDRGHAKIHQNLGHAPHQKCQPPGLSDVVHLGIMKEPSEHDDLH
jgi:hypothetical protein